MVKNTRIYFFLSLSKRTLRSVFNTTQKTVFLSFIFCMSVLFSNSLSYAVEPITGKTLIVYYSWGGHTEKLVEQMQKIIDADVVKLETVTAYPQQYRPITVQAKKELESGYRPPLRTEVPPLENYENIILASPLWWNTLAMPMFSFLDSYDLSGKNITLCITHGGSRMGGAMDDLKEKEPKEKVLPGLAIRDSDVSSSQEKVREWLNSLGFTTK